VINIIIYLKKEHDPSHLVEKLLRKKLIANASIDENNESFTIENDELIKVTYSVITAKTKSLLFNQITDFVETEIGTNVLINSVPIVASNKVFNDLILSKIIKI
jgi:uncharacterized protein involved in tolerance to divalent cations